MFLGTHAPKLDEKGRVILPAKFRDELASGMVITRGMEHCLLVFTLREFEALDEKIRQAPITDKRARDFIRVFYSAATQEFPDAQNRVSIPANLRSYASLERELTVIGVGNRAEIWDTATWEAYYEAQENDFANTAEEVIPGLF